MDSVLRITNSLTLEVATFFTLSNLLKDLIVCAARYTHSATPASPGDFVVSEPPYGL